MCRVIERLADSRFARRYREYRNSLRRHVRRCMLCLGAPLVEIDGVHVNRIHREQ